MSHGGQQGEVRAISGLRGGANGLAGGLPPCGPCEITFEFPARTDKVTLRQSVDRPKAQRRKPQGKGGWARKPARKTRSPMPKHTWLSCFAGNPEQA
jgi:hypothetical protein